MLWAVSAQADDLPVSKLSPLGDPCPGYKRLDHLAVNPLEKLFKAKVGGVICIPKSILKSIADCGRLLA
jgi:hypothetical protein